MRNFEVLKVFNLSSAPEEIREAEELLGFRPDPITGETEIAWLVVGNHESLQVDPADEASSRAITYAEHRLHQWFKECGAANAEKILLCWSESGALGCEQMANNNNFETLRERSLVV